LQAEANTSTIATLYSDVDSLYGQQRELFVQLQRALLPQTLPSIPGLEFASAYVAGADGVDIGGDWYSVIGTKDDEFAFVVGDVSGRGLDAVAVMAHARFTLRAYLIDGDSPEVALEKCSHQFDITVDLHMTTALVGVGNARTGEIRVASAGHPVPLLMSDDEAHFVAIPVGPPLGTGPASYTSTTFVLPHGASLIAYTDGLIERREEAIDTGMERLTQVAREGAYRTPEGLVSHLLETLRSDDAADDIATLVLRRDKP
jgi:serine phosphatase RsbU (regulator of sigma subunit)